MSARNSYNVAPIPGDNNGGSGGGGGEPVGGGLPVGSVIPYAGATAPPKFALCNGTEYPLPGGQDLFNVIGFSYGVNPGSSVMTGPVGGYGYDNATNNLNLTSFVPINTFIKVGTYVKLSGFTASTGVDINGMIVRITVSNVAINSAGGGTIDYQGSFVNPLSGLGGGGTFTTLTRFSVPIPDLSGRFPIGFNATYPRASTGGSATTTLSAANLPLHRHGFPVPGGTSLSSGSGLRAGTANFDDGSTTFANETYLENGSTSVSNSAFTTIPPYIALNYLIKSTA